MASPLPIPSGAGEGTGAASDDRPSDGASPASPASRGRPRAGASDVRTGVRALSDRALLAITAAVTLPLFWMGYGTDLDIGDVLATADGIRAGDYAPSRNPGVPVVESIVAVLDPVGGHLLVNLATVGALAATVVCVAHLVSAWGHDNGDLVALVFLATPIVVISGTQTADFVWAVAFLTGGALLLVRERPVAAGLVLALAVGSRSSTVLLVGALVLAVGWAREDRRRALTAGVVAAGAGVLLYVPAWLAYDRSFGFLDATDGWVGLANNAGRWALKNYAVAGLALVVVIAVAVPALVRSLRRWNDDAMLRFAVLGLLVSEGLFLRMPWKPAHLVPCVLVLALWIGASSRNSRGFLSLVIVATALNGLIVFRPAVADDPNSTGGADFEPTLTVGWYLNEIDCRLEFMDEPPRLDSGSWACTLEPMRGPANGATGELG